MICEELDGPVYEPASGNPPRQLVVLLHGYGDTGDGLIDLAPALARFMPDARFVAPHAPEPFELAFFGRQWFSLEDLDDMSAIEAGAERARPVLDAFLDEELAVAGLPESRLAILGFSQGARMALYTAFR
ncbi:MAG: phospholipase, partial [Pseudomonadota bacterium]|nr:phospholipase [Pseudomonadota bacterium]